MARRLVPAARDEQARLSARLDGSPLADRPAGGGWASALKLEEMPNADIVAIEHASLVACFDAEPDLAPRFFDEPMVVLQTLHGHVCARLVDSPGALRRTRQAIHDGGQGRVVYNPPAPEALPGLMDELALWLGGPGRDEHPVVVAGTVQERILEWLPFEAANGRVARAASRVVLRACGLDPWGVAVPERWLAADPAGYYGEVAATIRRRGDLRRWLERYGEALVSGLAAAADAAAGSAAEVPQRARAAAAALAPGEELTVTGYAGDAGVGRDEARADLRALARAGLVLVEPGTQGLRYRRTGS